MRRSGTHADEVFFHTVFGYSHEIADGLLPIQRLSCFSMRQPLLGFLVDGALYLVWR